LAPFEQTLKNVIHITVFSAFAVLLARCVEGLDV
jgi:hypothetical protein